MDMLGCILTFVPIGLAISRFIQEIVHVDCGCLYYLCHTFTPLS